MSTRWLCASAIGFTVRRAGGFAWNIQSMIVFRARRISRRLDPPLSSPPGSPFVDTSGSTSGHVGTIVSSLTPGPTIAWIPQLLRHWLFFINVVPGILGGGADAVRIDRPNLSLLKGADYLGIALMAVFLGCLEYTLEEGPRWEWLDDEAVRATAWIAAIAGIAFVWRGLTFKHPVVDLRALKSRNFALGCLFSFVTGIGIFATIYLTPLFLGRVRGFSALDIGLAVFSTGVFQVMGIPVYTVLAKRIDLRWLMMFGLACFAAGMWCFTPMTHERAVRELLRQAFRGFAQLFAVVRRCADPGSLPPDRLSSPPVSLI
jgi:DHA2 family multidrug resistance protein